jgi:raffinose/stachyose/melibiose transport system permease protein
MNIKWPGVFKIYENYSEVLSVNKNVVLRAFFNSIILTVLSIALLVIICSMAGFVMQRRTGRATPLINFLVLAGLMIPPAVVPTIWVLNGIGLFKTIPGLILVEAALSFPFSSLLYKSFMATIPKEIDEAAIIDGCDGPDLFFRIILPLLKSVTSTIIVLSSVSIFNDFVNPLYFLPGAKNVTVQLTLYSFLSIYQTKWNLLFADVVLITIPPFLLFLFFNKKIVSGMTAGAVKG